MSKKLFAYELDGISLMDKSFGELLLMIEEEFNNRDERNKTKTGFDSEVDRTDSNIIRYFEILNNVKKCAEENRFTDGMEQAMKLKLFMGQHSVFNQFVGDYAIANLFGAMTRIVTSRFFNVLENLEKTLKLEGSFPQVVLETPKITTPEQILIG